MRRARFSHASVAASILVSVGAGCSPSSGISGDVVNDSGGGDSAPVNDAAAPASDSSPPSGEDASRDSGSVRPGEGGATPVDGACGSAASQLDAGSSPSSGLCSAGSASAVSGSGPWTWTCAGSGGGKTATCQTSAGSIRFYASASFWNEPIGASPNIDVNSGNIVTASIAPYASGAEFSNGDDWGIGLVHASSTDKTYTIACLLYFCSGPVSFPIPHGALPTTGSDHHLTVIDGDQELDMWQAAYDAATDSWSAGSRFIDNLYGWGANAAPGQRAGGAVAAGYSEMGGVVRPEEVAQGYIDHALSMMIPSPGSAIVGPATSTDGRNTGSSALPEGAHIQLDPSVDVASQPWPAWEKTLAVALQTYGAYVSDTGGAVAFYGQTDVNAGNVTWSSLGVTKAASLANLPWSQMRVLDLSILPVDNVGP